MLRSDGSPAGGALLGWSSRGPSPDLALCADAHGHFVLDLAPVEGFRLEAFAAGCRGEVLVPADGDLDGLILRLEEERS